MLKGRAMICFEGLQAGCFRVRRYGLSGLLQVDYWGWFGDFRVRS